MTKKYDKVYVYTDGSSNGTSGCPVGWAWVLIDPDGNEITHCMGGETSGSNNTAEITAAIEGLSVVPKFNLGDVCLVTDSKYVIGIATGEFEPVKNLELCKLLRKTFIESKASVRWVKGHSGNQYNHRADQLAGLAREIQEPVPFKIKKLTKKRHKKARRKAIKNEVD